MEGETQKWDYSIFWHETQNQIRAQISEQEYVMWFRNLQYYASRENEIILAVPSSFYRDQVKQRYLKLIQDTLFDLSGMPIQVSFEIVKMQPPSDHSTDYHPPKTSPSVVDNSNAQSPDPSLQEGSSDSPAEIQEPNKTHRTQNTSPSKNSKSNISNKPRETEKKKQAGFTQGNPLNTQNETYPHTAPDSQAGTQKSEQGTSPDTPANAVDQSIPDASVKKPNQAGISKEPLHSKQSLYGSHQGLPLDSQQYSQQHSTQGQPRSPQQGPQQHIYPHLQSQGSQLHLRKHNELRIDYTFENFVVGDNNSFAANASIAISKNPGTAYNPCLIYGGVGLGKTHLIQSIGNYVYNNYEKIRVVYVTAETFTNEFIQAIRDGKNHQFKNRYRNVDVLLIDDIHFLQSKDQTQEELFHTFNALYDSNKQMVFTCDRPVSELKHLTDRLRSRFERGLNVDLQPPDYETRYAILKRKTEEKRAAIDEKVIELISKNITTNVRDLEAALTKLIAYSDILNKKITVDIAQEQLKDVFSSPKQSNITIEIIQRAVGDYFNLSPYDLRGKKRTKAIAFPRQIAMYITREITEYSTTEVGLEFGGRDHTTVMHACQRIESRMQTDPYLEPTIQRLIRQIKEYGTK